MSLHYLLDGYNITNQMQGLSLKSLEEQRQCLIKFIEMKRPQGSVKNKVTIVFDGQSGIIGGMSSSVSQILFSHNESADDKLIRIVKDAEYKKSIVVVTDDREIHYTVRALGAKISSVKEFLSKVKTPNLTVTAKDAKGRGLKEDKFIPKTLEFKITEEFEKIWLKSKRA